MFLSGHARRAPQSFVLFSLARIIDVSSAAASQFDMANRWFPTISPNVNFSTCIFQLDTNNNNNKYLDLEEPEFRNCLPY